MNFITAEIGKGNRKVFKKLFDQHYQNLVYFANGYLFDIDASKDIVQEVFIYIWDNSEKLRIQYSLKAYLYAMVRNRCLNLLKALKVTDNFTFLDFNISLILDADFEPKTEQTKSTGYQQILDSIDALPERMQKIVKRKFLYNYKNAQIANELGISVNTVKTQLKRAKLVVIQNTKPEMPAPNFNYENYKGGKTTLKDLKGKLVYIEIWATWCGPCIKEMPALTQLIKDFKGKNIEFVSISVDSKRDYKNWRKMIPEKNVGGIQLLANKSLESNFMKAFGIGLIPRTLILDEEGKIITPKAPRPSATNTKRYIYSLLTRTKTINRTKSITTVLK